MKYLYVMRHDFAVNSFYKIGISNRPERRHKEVNSTYKVKVLFCFLLWDAEKKEAQLHRRYKTRHVKTIPKHVSGRTEFFDIDFVDVFLLRWEIALLSFIQLFTLPLAVAFLVYLLLN